MKDYQFVIHETLRRSRDYGIKNPAFPEFVRDTGERLTRLSGALSAAVELVPSDAADIRAEAAVQSVRRLAHSLERMQGAEPWLWFPANDGVCELLGLNGDEDITVYRDAIDQWVRLTIAISKATEGAESKTKKPTKTESAAGFVNLLAQSWLKHYGSWPSGAERSPFYQLLRELLPILPLKVKELSPPIVIAILRDNKPV